MQKEITTQLIQDKFKVIYEKFVDIVCENENFKNNNLELSLLLNKINSNISVVMLLVSKAIFNEACIIFRSLFESTVLFEYLIEYPDKMKQYKLDDLISEFQKLFLSYKRGFVPISHIIEPYNILRADLKDVIPFEESSDDGLLTYNIEMLGKYFQGGRDGFKPLSQQTTRIIQELLKSDNIHKDLLYNLQVEFYNTYAQISHNRLNTLLSPVEPITNIKMLAQIQEMYKNCIVIYKIIFETLENKFKFQKPNNFWKVVIEMGDYLEIPMNL